MVQNVTQSPVQEERCDCYQQNKITAFIIQLHLILRLRKSGAYTEINVDVATWPHNTIAYGTSGNNTALVGEIKDELLISIKQLA